MCSTLVYLSVASSSFMKMFGRVFNVSSTITKMFGCVLTLVCLSVASSTFSKMFGRVFDLSLPVCHQFDCN